MNEFDQFVKHVLKVKYYVRYTDDFAIVAESREYLEKLLPLISRFLEARLGLTLHPKKITVRAFHQGVDFLGYVIFPRYRLVRSKTRRRIFAKIQQRIEGYKAGIINRITLEQSLRSYLGVLSHADSYRLQEELMNGFWFSITN